MASRVTYNGSSTGVPWKNTGTPEGFGDQYARHIATLYGATHFALTAVSGTADDVTANLGPELGGSGLTDGMMFGITWASDNTGPMTLAINGGSAVDVLDASGGAMFAGSVSAGDRAVIEYISGSFRIVSGGSSSLSAGPSVTVFTVSGTWTKPGGYSDDHMVLIRAWGAGAGGAKGSNGGGGGGGAYCERIMRMADLPSSVAVTIGAGGAARTTTGDGNNGGNTTFGALLTAYGGTGGENGVGPSTSRGGPGAGELASGTLPTGGSIGGGGGGNDAGGSDAQTLWGGGGGGGGRTGGTAPGGKAVFGGGGGGGSFGTGSTGGQSKFGGAGGDGGDGSPAATAGAAPGGGGGGASGGDSGAGGRGQVEVWIL